MTIEERAKQFAMNDASCYCCEAKTDKNSTKMCPCRKACDSYFLYLRIAKKQREIDIQKSVEWMKGVFLEQYLTTVCSGGYENNVFNDKFFSEFEQAMKGEEK